MYDFTINLLDHNQRFLDTGLVIWISVLWSSINDMSNSCNCAPHVLQRLITPTFEALMVKFGGKIGTLYQMLKNAFKKHPLQNRTNVQIKGGGGQRPFEQCSKKLHFFEMMASLSRSHP